MFSKTKLSKKIRVAVVQTGSIAFDLELCLVKLEKLTKAAVENGAKLILFPEAFLSAYPRGSSFGAGADKYSTEEGEGRERYRKYWDSSIDIPGPAIDRLSAIAKEHNVFLVVGVIERELGTLYCCAVHFDDKGEFLGKHRKLVPTFNERMVWGRGDGSTIPVYDTPIGKIGTVICYENYMPLLRMTMYQKGIQIYCAPTACGTEQWNATARHVALEGRCFVLSCNQFTVRSDYPENWFDPSFESVLGSRAEGNADYIVSRGGSSIVNPLGQYLAGPVFDREEILYADLDLDDCIRGKMDVDVVGHYSRPDVFTLHVNSEPTRNIVHSNSQSEKPVKTSPLEEQVDTLGENLKKNVHICCNCKYPK